VFLFERDLEEARWKLKKDIDEDKIRDTYHRIGTAEGTLSFHKNLIRSDQWLKSNVKRMKFTPIKEALSETIARYRTQKYTPASEA